MNKLKITKKLLLTFRVILVIILVGIVSDWFVDFNFSIKRLLSISMFVIIGVAYLIGAIVTQYKWWKIIITICGIYLISFHFYKNTIAASSIGIICLIVPILIFKFSKEYKSLKDDS